MYNNTNIENTKSKNKNVSFIQNRMRSFSNWMKKNPNALNRFNNRNKVNQLTQAINAERWNDIRFNDHRPIEIFFPMTLREINKSVFETPSERFKMLLQMGFFPSKHPNADFGPGMYTRPYYEYMINRNIKPITPEPKVPTLLSNNNNRLSNNNNRLSNNNNRSSNNNNRSSIKPTRIKNNPLGDTYINSTEGNQIVSIDTLIELLNRSNVELDKFQGTNEEQCAKISRVLQKLMKKTELKCNYPIRLKNNSVSNTNKNQIMKSKFNINRPNNKQGYLTQLITPDPYYRRVPKDRTQASQTKLRQKYGLSKNNDRVVREQQVDTFVIR